MGNTIAYRELVHFGGPLSIGLETTVAPDQLPLERLLSHIHYMGKRGGFIQFFGCQQSDLLLSNYAILNPDPGAPFLVKGLLQLMDDCGPKMTFAHADIYSGKGIGIGKENGRMLRTIVLPYRPMRSSRGFTLFVRIDE